MIKSFENGQQPLLLIVGLPRSSRAPNEMVFDQGLGRFIHRQNRSAQLQQHLTEVWNLAYD
jgi:hypothetical protein